MPPIFDDSQYPLPNTDIIKTTGWPYRKDRLARGILAISLRCGGVDFADGNPVSREHLKEREYHHLFPKAWLMRNGFAEQDADIALNCALVTWKTNRALADKSPSEYISDRAKKSSLGMAEIEQRLLSHSIPNAEVMSDDYDAFRDRRAKELHSLMVRLCNGESK